MWQDTMLNQFHDVLPGTTISLVVDDVLAIYKRRISQAEGLIETALTSLYPGSHPVQSVQDIESLVIAIDSLRLNRNELVTLSDGCVLVQTGKDGSSKVNKPSNGDGSGPRAYQEDDKHILENGDFKMTISQGRITSLVDRQIRRELILPGPGADDGGLTLYEDYPLEWDAWDVEVYHLDSYEVLRFQEIDISSTGERAALKATVKFGQSKAVLTVHTLWVLADTSD